MAKRTISSRLALAKRTQKGLDSRHGYHRAKKMISSSSDSVCRPLLALTPLCPLLTLMGNAYESLAAALAEEGGGTPLRLFLSFSDGTSRAVVIQFSGRTLDDVWAKLFQELGRRYSTQPMARWLRFDWVVDMQERTWGELCTWIEKHKRNYFRHGISLDKSFRHAFLEMELNANAMLYGGSKIPHAKLNEKNFTRYVRRRYHSKVTVDFSAEASIYTFRTRGLFIEEGRDPVRINGFSGRERGRHAGRRELASLDSDSVYQLVDWSSQFLSEQVTPSGRFVYGLHPCFDREIKAYNALRHASTTYSMLEAWEVTRQESLKASIERSLDYLENTLIRCFETSTGEELAYLVDVGDEIKLGGNAVCLLAFVKYTELMEDEKYLSLLEKLALGVCQLQDPVTGRFDHVLNASDLSLKQAFRVIYYDGEAAFGLMRLYGLTGDPRWLSTVEKAFGYFIDNQYWKIHDHWLSYCVNELTIYCPEERYYKFGINNVADHLGFVINRITTFPTLLELMMAAHQMIQRLQKDPDYHHLLDDIDLDEFYRALETRAHYLLNGHFWPEVAMFFQNPQRILGSFFIRHHAFRVRIDDVEHYLSGYVAYLRKYLGSGGRIPARRNSEGDLASAPIRSVEVTASRQLNPVSDSPRVPPKPVGAPDGPAQHFSNSSDPVARWTVRSLTEAMPGKWIVKPSSPQWQATGISFTPVTMEAGHLVIVRAEGGKHGILPERLDRLPFTPQGLLVQPPVPSNLPSHIPIYQVASTRAAVLALGRYARRRMTGRVIGVTGSAGKTSSVAMFQSMLSHWGQSGATRHSANLPLGIAWNLASLAWEAPFQVIEMAIGRMRDNSALVEPDVAVFLNVGPAHLEYHETTENIARKKSAIFDSMQPGAHAVVNRDMEEWPIVAEAARRKGLKLISFGCHPQSDIRWVEGEAAHRAGGVTIDLAGEALRLPETGLGAHWVKNVMAGFGVLLSLGLSVKDVLPFLGRLVPPPGRGKRYRLAHPSGNGRLTLVDDAYNANPLSMEAMLGEMATLKVSGRKHLVLGDMLELGDDSAHYHRELVPRILGSGAECIWLVGDEMQKLVESLRPGVGRVEHFPDAASLVDALMPDLMPGDWVVFKGSNKFGLSRLAQNLAAQWGPGSQRG